MEKKYIKKIEQLEEEINKIKKRNKKVETEKAWETSTYRKISIIVITYILMIIVMYMLGMNNVFINAIIPTLGYFLSTLGVNFLKKRYIKNNS